MILLCNMNNYFENNKRIDCILVWGHGLPYLEQILAEIRNNGNFKVLKIIKHRPKNIKKFVKEVYSFDYAPFWHLKNKTKYLLKTEKEVCFIFIKNKRPEEDFLSEGSFRHKESLALKRFKDKIRNEFNPMIDNVVTHDHIIHATDSEEQTDQLLKYLGYEFGIELFCMNNGLVDMPHYLRSYNKFIFKEVDVKEIYCNISVGSAWNDFKVETIKIKESPHYLGLTQKIEIYKDYINKFIGGALKDDYNAEKYLDLSKNFKYLSHPYENSFVLVELIDQKLIVVDGLHRSCLHIKEGNKKIKICQLLKEQNF